MVVGLILGAGAWYTYRRYSQRHSDEASGRGALLGSEKGAAIGLEMRESISCATGSGTSGIDTNARPPDSADGGATGSVRDTPHSEAAELAAGTHVPTPMEQGVCAAANDARPSRRVSFAGDIESGALPPSSAPAAMAAVAPAAAADAAASSAAGNAAASRASSNALERARAWRQGSSVGSFFEFKRERDSELERSHGAKGERVSVATEHDPALAQVLMAKRRSIEAVGGVLSGGGSSRGHASYEGMRPAELGLIPSGMHRDVMPRDADSGGAPSGAAPSSSSAGRRKSRGGGGMTVYRELADGTLVMMTLEELQEQERRVAAARGALHAQSLDGEFFVGGAERAEEEAPAAAPSMATSEQGSGGEEIGSARRASNRPCASKTSAASLSVVPRAQQERGLLDAEGSGASSAAATEGQRKAAGGSTMRVYREAADGTLVLTTLEELQDTAVKAARRRSAAEAAAGARRLDNDFFDGGDAAGPDAPQAGVSADEQRRKPSHPPRLSAPTTWAEASAAGGSGSGGSGGASGGTRRSSRRGSSSNTSRCVMPHDQQQVKLLGEAGPNAGGTDALDDGAAPASEEPMFSSRALRAQSSGGGGGGERLSMGGTSKRRSSAVREGTGLDAGGLMAVYSEDSSGVVKFTTMEERQEELKREATRKAEAEGANETARL